jgi:predicted membrane metal-binding protein
MASQFHEDLTREQTEQGASERSFGLLFAVVFGVIALYPLLSGGAIRVWAIAASVTFAVAALALPRILAPLNKVWMSIGKLMHRVVSPVILGLLYLVAVVPTGLVLRMKGADPLRLKRDAAAKSYWIAREDAPASFKNQF